MTPDVMEEFGRWLYQDMHRGYTIIAHNFRSFDGQFILRHMTKKNLKVQVIKSGTQLLEIEYARMRMKSRDTLNFCALRLEQFPKSVGLGYIAAKGSFPHRIKWEYWDKIIDFPRPEDYDISGKSLSLT